MHFATTFERGADLAYPRGFVYSRAGNPTRNLFEREVARLEALRDGLESLLDAVTARHCDPEAVAFAAGRFAAMRIYRMHGRAEAMDFFNRCIATVEIADDLNLG